MKLDTLIERLAAGGVVVLETVEWERVASGFATVAEHATGLAGALLVVRHGDALYGVEEPDAAHRTLRRFADAAAADAFVAARLAAYDRLWDG
jgi:hypothetical protein